MLYAFPFSLPSNTPLSPLAWPSGERGHGQAAHCLPEPTFSAILPAVWMFRRQDRVLMLTARLPDSLQFP